MSEPDQAALSAPRRPTSATERDQAIARWEVEAAVPIETAARQPLLRRALSQVAESARRESFAPVRAWIWRTFPRLISRLSSKVGGAE